MYELLVLSLLMHWPLHAYRLAKIANEVVGPEERISPGTLSTLLTKLERAGLIQPADHETVPFPTDRPSQAYMITPSGRERFIALMLDITSHPGLYRRLFHVKALHLEFLPLEQQLFLVEHYLTHCREMLQAKQTETETDAKNPLKQRHMSSPFRQAAFAYMQLKIEQWQLELHWAESLRDQIILRLKQAGTSEHPLS